jgi:hypothetical protein
MSAIKRQRQKRCVPFREVSITFWRDTTAMKTESWHSPFDVKLCIAFMTLRLETTSSSCFGALKSFSAPKDLHENRMLTKWHSSVHTFFVDDTPMLFGEIMLGGKVRGLLCHLCNHLVRARVCPRHTILVPV